MVARWTLLDERTRRVRWWANSGAMTNVLVLKIRQLLLPTVSAISSEGILP